MNPRLKASRAAVELIKQFEGYRRASAQLPDGRWTIGYGHTRTAREGVEISEDDAETLLLYDLGQIQVMLDETVFTPLNQNQVDALAAFAFGVGMDNFRRSSVLRRVNEGNLVQAACAIEMWRKADLDGERIVVDALVRRRAAEKALFLTPVGAWTPAPAALVKPRVDYDVAASLPRTSAETPFAPEPVSAAAAAAEAVAERLRALDLAEADAGIDLGPPPIAPPEDVEEEAAPPEPEPQPEPQAEPEPELAATAPAAPEAPPAEPPPPPTLTAEDFSRPIAHREGPVYLDAPPAEEPGGRIRVGPLLAVGLVGLVLFAGSVFWGLNAPAAPGGVDPMAAASVFGLLGVGMVAIAVYYLLLKLGGKSG